MRGLVSCCLVTNHPDLFIACGCLSTHFPLREAKAGQYLMHINNISSLETKTRNLMDIDSEKRPSKTGRYWFDYGTRGLDAGYEPMPLLAVRDWMATNGKAEGADHNETSWRRRLQDVLTFLLVEETPE